ncbi:MAG: DoxX family protein [Chitinophagaceae bacterium]|nr:MAG: DoxX family protein [Chitinophagaceae bacterium]
MKILLNIFRVIVGVLFIFSGLVKANDPLGLSYKMQEFFEVWGLHGLNSFTLAFSIIMIGFEIIAGVAVLLGWRMKLFSWLLLLLIIFFTFLTAYAVFSGKIKECGCFGDCIPLTAMQSFLKDLLLLILIGVIFLFKDRILPATGMRNSVVILLFTAIFSFAFQWFVLLHLPVVDCLPYKKGNNIAEKMKIPPGAIPDSTVITFVYEVGGKQTEFTADKFPDDFDDDRYKFIKRYDKLIRKGNAETAIKDFTLQTVDGNDTTQAILDRPGYTILLFVQGGYNRGEQWEAYLQTIVTGANNQGIEKYLVTSLSIEDLANNPPAAFTAFTPLLCDATAIKTAARANPTLYVLKQGVVINKWSYADFDKALTEIQQLK